MCPSLCCTVDGLSGLSFLGPAAFQVGDRRHWALLLVQALCCCPQGVPAGWLQRPGCCAGVLSGAVMCCARSWHRGGLLCRLLRFMQYGHVERGGWGAMCVWYLALMSDWPKEPPSVNVEARVYRNRYEVVVSVDIRMF